MTDQPSRPDRSTGTDGLEPATQQELDQALENELWDHLRESEFVDSASVPGGRPVAGSPSLHKSAQRDSGEDVYSADGAVAESAEDSRDDDDDRATPTIWEQMGGPMGMVDSGLPVLVFVIVNAITSLTPAIYAALGAGVLIAVIRLMRKKPVTQAIAGLFGVGIAAFIAYKSGSAKGFFALGIWSYLVYGGALIASILVRWPLIGVIWEGINGRGSGWRQDRKLVRRYDWASAVWIAIFAARYLVQDSLYDSDQVGWLATAKIAMGYPLYFVGIGLTVWIIKGYKPAARPAA